MNKATRVTWKGAPAEAQTSGPRFAARSRLLDTIFEAERPARALDIGCGRGAVTRLLARRAGKVLATEVTEQGVRAASEALLEHDNVTVRLANLFDAGSSDLSPDGPFDLILLSEVLEHLDDDAGALETVNGLLADDGLLVITVPRDPAFWSIEDEMWGHKRRYTRDGLLGRLKDAGFQPQTVWTWGFPITRQVVKYQVSRLRPRAQDVEAGSPPVTTPPKPLLPLVRTTFGIIVRIESLFKHSDRGIGYVVTACKPPAR